MAVPEIYLTICGSEDFIGFCIIIANMLHICLYKAIIGIFICALADGWAQRARWRRISSLWFDLLQGDTPFLQKTSLPVVIGSEAFSGTIWHRRRYQYLYLYFSVNVGVISKSMTWFVSLPCCLWLLRELRLWLQAIVFIGKAGIFASPTKKKNSTCVPKAPCMFGLAICECVHIWFKWSACECLEEVCMLGGTFV